MPTSGDFLRTAGFVVVVSYVLISRIRRDWKIGLISDESYLTQRPLLIVSVLAFALFAGAVETPETINNTLKQLLERLKRLDDRALRA